MPHKNSKRIPELDAIRGMAAFSVVVYHYIPVLMAGALGGTVASRHLLDILELTPLGLLWAGHQAVVLFFVLSGFVLTLMLESGHASYPAYALRRVMRLYFPYVAAVAIGVTLEFSIAPQFMHGLDDWINKFWSWPITMDSLFKHAIVVGEFNADRYDFTIWSLVQELRISLIFPLLLIFARRTRWWIVLGTLFTLSVAMGVLNSGLIPHWNLPMTRGGFTNYTLTLHYLLTFGIGIVLAQHRHQLQVFFANMTKWKCWAFAIMSAAIYLDGGRLMELVSGTDEMILRDWPIAMGSAGLVAFAACCTTGTHWLTRKPFTWLGTISYSVYLFHPLVLLAALHLFYGKMPLLPLLGVTFVATFPLSAIMWRVCEHPATGMSRRVGRWLQNSRVTRVRDTSPT